MINFFWTAFFQIIHEYHSSCLHAPANDLLINLFNKWGPISVYHQRDDHYLRDVFFPIPLFCSVLRKLSERTGIRADTGKGLMIATISKALYIWSSYTPSLSSTNVLGTHDT